MEGHDVTKGTKDHQECFVDIVPSWRKSRDIRADGTTPGGYLTATFISTVVQQQPDPPPPLPE